MPDVVRELLLTVAAIKKLGARRTLEPSTLLVITGWGSTERERKMLGG